ncbi:type I polyketide synthase [Aspergillus aculeatinus CBS 121060]|uniref:Ketoacyl-synt-domain-containing protein n=1 Tax=Aspergillus aculeatinus CBS 121060 TaxID=1448322 RepID=A0ACD1H2Q7_9EURO|nr:ketoacyl-synt-domain-containing protein [Aspergillus aculeatinus CBS 121060]RAH67812.1 ketoacyl-synt-domain-containing protein [Aspergillus aculeatinus CBS 121060]
MCHDSHPAKEFGPEPLAIVGMALRLPGGVNTPEDFWDFLLNKQNGHGQVPGSRYNIDAFHHPSRTGSVRTKDGYFLPEDPAYFDHQFFSLTPFEASRLDPQQRLLLEVIYECMESGGQVGWRGQGRKIGCFVGVFGEDWYDMQSKDTQRIDRLHVLGTGYFALSNRISYEFDLTGPSMTLATGCSSSMVGLHEACQAILSGDCESAIVAGTNLILTPTMTTTMSDNLVLSPSGICRTFDAGADGYGRAEGVNALYIKRLADAVRDEDPIRAVIRATATNCDGRTPGITTPGSVTQMALVREAYKRAQIQKITDTGFFECHGTGTVAGDTAETSVVGELFRESGVIIGSVKPNMGHSEGASGITSIVKTALALEHRTIPPNIFFRSPNPSIPFEECKLVVPVDSIPWPAHKKLRASVNCFGIGGANAHAILEPAPTSCRQTQFLDARSPHKTTKRLLVLSAASAQALSERARSLEGFLANKSQDLNDVAHTLGVRREHLKYRTFAIVSSDTEVGLQELPLEASPSPEVTLVFTGQGAQWAGMARELLENSEDFKSDVQHMDNVLRSAKPPPSWSIAETLLAPEAQSKIHDPRLSQPVCTAIQIAITNQLRDWGFKVSSVIGHSSGEIAAAYAAGAISLRSAIMIAYHRGRLAQNVSDGSMAAVGLSRKEVEPWLAEGAVIACENSPQSITISGDTKAVHSTIDAIRSAYPDAFCRTLKVTKAYHSPKMQPMAADYAAAIAPEAERVGTHMLPMYSTVLGEVINDPARLDSEYWSRNLISTVEFNKAMKDMLRSQPDHDRLFIEVGPHSALQGPLRQIFDSTKFKGQNWYIPTLVRAVSAEDALLRAAGLAYSRGAEIDLLRINGPGKVVDCLPRYPWQHLERHWSESRLSESWRQREFPHHELLGSRVLESSSLEPSWRNVLQIHNCTWLGHHKLFRDTVFPCAGYIAMVGEAIRQHCHCEGYEIRNMILKKPLFLQETSGTEVLTSLKPERLSDIADSEWFDFTVLALDGTEWGKYCHGQIRAISPTAIPKVSKQPRWTREVEPADWYQFLARLGLNYGTSFQRMKEISVDPVEHLANATVLESNSDYEGDYLVHPTVIDHCLQLLSVAVVNGIRRHATSLAIPASIDRISIVRTEGDMWIQTDTCSALSSTSMSGNVTMLSEAGPALVIIGATCISLANDEPDNESPIPLMSQLEWAPCIDLISPAEWLRPKWEERGVSLMAELTCFYILETTSQIAGLVPATTHLARYQSWLMRTHDQLTNRTTQTFLQIPWQDMTSNERHGQAAKIQEQLTLLGRGVDRLGEVLRRVSENASQIIQGHVAPLEILSMDVLRDVYDFNSSLSDWRSFLSLVGHWNPRLRILEIGAGTGATCAQVIASLRSKGGERTWASYTFTDISPAFFSTAAERFSEHENIAFQTLDITQDPLQQGFTSASYDLIIISNVIHATPSLRGALKNVYKLMAPAGYLVLQELCPGDDGRQLSPYVKPERWHNELLQAGFTGAMCVALDNKPPYQQNANIISRRPAEYMPAQKVTLVSVSAESTISWEKRLEEKLLEQGYHVDWATLHALPANTECLISLLDLHAPGLHDMDEARFEQMKNLFSMSSNMPLIHLTRSVQTTCHDPRLGLALGFSRTLRREIVGKIVTVELDALNEGTCRAVVDIYHRTRQKVPKETLIDDEYVVRNGQVYTSRVHWHTLRDQLQEEPKLEAPRCLSIQRYGLVDSLNWKAIPDAKPVLEPTELEIDVHYVGLNFRDLMVTLGVMGDASELGIEASATVRRVGDKVTRLKAGDRVVVCGKGLFRTRAHFQEHECTKIPPGLSLEDAAAVSAVYATAFYALITVGQLQPGQTVLIHCATGGVGLAAIHICQEIGATIYATAGLPEKRGYLHTEYGIPAENIFTSRDDSFRQGVMSRTAGAGVDLVLNSLAGSLLHASWQCVAKFGKMIELGKRDFLARGSLSMDLFIGNRSFFGVDMLGIMAEQPRLSQRLMNQFVEWYKDNRVRPIRPLRLFAASEVAEAFKYMQSGNHMGKIVVKMPTVGDGLCTSPVKIPMSLSADKSYLLAGGLGGIGRAVATWLVEKGARHLIFLSRSAGRRADHERFVCELARQGCGVEMVSGDVARLQDVEVALSKAAGRAIGGVIQMSMVLQDESLAKMTHSHWLQTIRPKVDGTYNLHWALEAHESSLDFFVLFSSMSSVVGTVGQSNYAAANSFLDAFVLYRRQLGGIASVLNLGVVEDIGCVHQDQATLNRVRSTGARLLREEDVVNALHAAILFCRLPPDPAKMTSSVMMVGVSSVKPLSAPGVTPLWGPDIRFSMYENLCGQAGRDAETDETDLKGFFSEIQSNPDLLDDPATELRIMSELCNLINAHMSRDGKENDDMANIAIDSLMSIEIRNWFRRQLGMEISLTEISKAGTVGGLSRVCVATLKERYSVPIKDTESIEK